MAETPRQPFAFQQVLERVRIWSTTEAAPTLIMLPANEMAEIPSVGFFTRDGRVAAGELCEGNSKGCDAWLTRAAVRRTLLGRLVSRRFELRDSVYVETMSTRAAIQLTEK